MSNFRCKTQTSLNVVAMVITCPDRICIDKNCQLFHGLATFWNKFNVYIFTLAGENRVVCPVLTGKTATKTSLIVTIERDQTASLCHHSATPV